MILGLKGLKTMQPKSIVITLFYRARLQFFKSTRKLHSIFIEANCFLSSLNCNGRKKSDLLNNIIQCCGRTKVYVKLMTQ